MEALRTPTQSLLFVLCDRRSKDFCEAKSCSSGEKKIKAYVLLPTVITVNNPKICQLFRKNDVRVLNGQEFPALIVALQNNDAQIVELVIAERKAFKCSRVFTEVGNAGIVQSILGKSVMVQKMKCNPSAPISAIDGENVKIVERILTVSADINYRNPRGGTFLHLAALRKDAILAKLLLNRGATVDSLRNDSSTPLHLAVQEGSVTIVKLLVEKGASLDVRKYDGSTCLDLAVARNRPKIFEVLLQGGATFPTQTEDCLRLLRLAVENNSDKIVKKILRGGVNDPSVVVEKNNTNSELMFLAVEQGLYSVVKRLLDLGVDVNTQNSAEQTVLQLAFDQENPKMVEVILQHSPDLSETKNKSILRDSVLREGKVCDTIVKKLLKYGLTIDRADKNNNELFHKAVKKNYAEIVQQLFKCGAYANVKYNNFDASDDEDVRPLLMAVRCENENVVRVLLENGADPDFECVDRNIMPLFEAVKTANLRIVKMLLEHGASVESYPEALIHAVDKRYIEIVEALLKHGANPNQRDSNDKQARIPIVCAANKYDLELIDMLLTFGADVNGRDGKGKSPLLVACGKGHLPIIEYLIRNNADLCLKDSAENTPMIMAASRWAHSFRPVEMLLKWGAACDHRNERGDSPLHLAVRNDHKRMLQCFLDHGFTNEELITRTGICSMFSVSNACSQNRNRWCDKQFSRILTRHLIKMEAAGLRHNEVMPDQHFEVPSKEKLRKDCEMEVARMKAQNINDTKVSYHDVLCSSVHRLTCYARNDNIIYILEAKDLEENFPIYGSIIRCQLEKGIFRKNLMKEGVKTFDIVFKKFAKLPDGVVEKLLGYLDNQEIIVFVNAVFPVDVEYLLSAFL